MAARITKLFEAKPKKTRKGPTESATLFAVGTRKRGNDGGMWVVRATTAGVHQWRPQKSPAPRKQRTATTAAPSRRKSANQDTKAVRTPAPSRRQRTAATAAPRRRKSADQDNKAVRTTATPASSGRRRTQHQILFCEPYTLTSIRQLKNKTRSALYGPIFTVTDAFYETLLRKPKSIKRRNGNAYIFGRRFPLDQYSHVGNHGNDGAQTGFVDLDLYANGDEVLEIVLEAYEAKRGMISWDNRSALRKVRAQLPHILFIGETVGGDVGADLYAHRTHGKIDGLIIDNNLLFANRHQEGDKG